MKRTISFLLCLVLLIGCLSTAVVAVSAVDGTAMVYNGFNNVVDVSRLGVLSLAGNGTKSLDIATKYAGDGSLRVDMAETHANYMKPYAFYFDIDHDYIDYSQYDYAEVVYKSDEALSGTYNMQIHLIDTAVSIAGSGYDYDAGGVSMDGQWHRWTLDLDSPYYTLDGIGNNINRVRFIMLNYTGTYQEVDMNIDTVFFCDKTYAEARTKAEQDVAALIAALPSVTESNYQSLAGQFEAIETELAAGKETYENFMPANYADYTQKKTQYDAFASGVGITIAFDMPNFFANKMMFQQNKPINLFGVSTAGKTVSAELYQGDASQPLQTVQAEVPRDGNWSLSFDPKEGGYSTYRIVVYEDAVPKKVLQHLLVGELWLAAGQSNMEYRLDWEVNGAAEIAAANDPYLRVMMMDTNPVGTNGPARATPTFDIAGVSWVDASNGNNIASMSAYGYYAAKELRNGLDVPVGIINAALGSTNIQSWLSRESIEANQVVKSALKRSNLYMTEEQSASTPSDYRHMTAMFNTKVGPLAGLNLGGVFWCQGESNRDGKPYETGYYCEAIQALASGYSKIFGFEKGDMPVMVINIANHTYLNDPQNIPKWIEEIADAAKASPNIVNIPIYDVPLTYKNPPSPSVAYAIHPNNKHQGGKRAGLAALHNACGVGSADYYAPTVTSFEVRDRWVYVNFDNAVDGLTTLNDAIGVHGFTLAGEDNVYLPASAEIYDKDTVRVWNDSISQPKNVTYAFNSHAQTANLCNSYNLPAIPYRSDRTAAKYFSSNDWLYCDDTSVFVDTGATGDYQPTWQTTSLSTVDSTDLSVDKKVKYEGTGSLKLSYTAHQSSLAFASATFGYNLMPIYFRSHKYVSVMVKNDDNRAKRLYLMVGTKDGTESWLAAELTEGQPTYGYELPAGSDFTRYTFHLSDLKGYNTDSAQISLSTITRMELVVEDTTNGSVHIDGIALGVQAPLAAEDQPTEPTEPAIPATPKYGDINKDRKVDATDALWALQVSVNKRTLDKTAQKAADVNGDNKTDAADALLILKKSVNKIDKFPVEEA